MVDILVTQHEMIREIAVKENCIIVGRGANILLCDKSPFRIFVYADMGSKIARCKLYAPENEHLSEKELQREIRRMDIAKAKEYELSSDLR